MPVGRPSNPEFDRAVELACGGMDIRQAWMECNQPGGEKGLQNIRKRKRKRMTPAELMDTVE